MALRLAQNNAKIQQLNNIQFLYSDLFTNLSPQQKFDLIISNPPYVSPSEYEKLAFEVKKQPLEALLATENGTIFYRQILQNAPDFLAPHSLLIMEISPFLPEKLLKLIID
jgi:release factor glutamine methyltransferase